MNENILEQLSPETLEKYNEALANGANEAHFTYADNSFHRYDIADLPEKMELFRTRNMGLRLVKTNPSDKWDWQELASLPFWNSFVDDRILSDLYLFCVC